MTSRIEGQLFRVFKVSCTPERTPGGGGIEEEVEVRRRETLNTLNTRKKYGPPVRVREPARHLCVACTIRLAVAKDTINQNRQWWRSSRRKNERIAPVSLRRVEAPCPRRPSSGGPPRPLLAEDEFDGGAVKVTRSRPSRPREKAPAHLRLLPEGARSAPSARAQGRELLVRGPSAKGRDGRPRNRRQAALNPNPGAA